jgi:hypothetical protein
MKHALKRIAALYGMLDRMRSVELRMAAAAVEEVERVAAMHHAVSIDQQTCGRAALVTGDRAEWMLSKAAREFAEVRIAQLVDLREARAEVLDAAVIAHRQSRLKVEQIDRVVDRARTAQALDQARRTQAVADDRYASRRAWSQTESARTRAAADKE